MDIISAVLLGITAFFLLFGLLFGLKRGALRSSIRIVMVVFAFLIAWLCKDTYVNIVLNINIGGMTIGESVSQSFAGPNAFLVDIIMSLIEGLLGAVLFIAVFFALKLITEIIFLIIGCFLPKEKDYRGVGALIGLLQGALIAFCICAPINGLVGNVSQLFTLKINGSSIVDDQTNSQLKAMGVDFEGYRTGLVSMVYTAVGDGFYRSISAGNTADGDRLTLSGVVEAAEFGTKAVDIVVSLQDLDMTEGLTEEHKDVLRSKFSDLDQAKAGLSKDGAKALNTIMSSAISGLAGEEIIGADQVKEILGNVDFTQVNFGQECELIFTLSDYATGEQGDVSVEDVVRGISKSTILLPVLEVVSEEMSVAEIPEDKVAEFEAAIESLGDPEMEAKLRTIFGLN